MATSDTGELKSHEMLYLCMHATWSADRKRTQVSACDKIGIEHKNPEIGGRGVLWVGRQTIPVRRLLVVQYSTVLYKERKEIEVVYNYNYRLHSKSIHPEFPTFTHKKKDRNLLLRQALSAHFQL